MKIKTFLLATLPLIGISQASVTLLFFDSVTYISGFQNGQGSISGFPARLVWGVVVDGDGDGFDGADPLTPYDDGFSLERNHTGPLNLWTGESTDDRIFIAPAVMNLTTSAVDGAAIYDNRILAVSSLEFAGTASAGDRFAVIWFDTTTLSGTANQGLKYGLLEHSGFILPNDGSTTLYARPFAGPDQPKPLTGILGVPAPEPSSALLGQLGMVGLMRRRR